MSNHIHKINCFFRTEYNYEESWLQDMARKGWQLKKRGFLFSTFDKAEPVNRRYRIIPTAIEKMKPEEKELFEDAGWIYHSHIDNISYYYTDNEDVVEMFTDRQGWMYYFRKYLLYAILDIFIIMFTCYGIWKNGYGYYSPNEMLHGFEGRGLGFIICAGYLSLFPIFILFTFIIKEIQFIRKYKKAEANQYISYKKRRHFGMLYYGIFFLVIMAVFVLAFHDFDVTSKTVYYPEVCAYKSDVLVKMEELDPLSWKQGEPILKQLSQTKDFTEDSDGYYVTESTDVIFKKNIYQLYTMQSDQYYNEIDANGTGVLYIQDYWKARSEKLAIRYMEEEILYQIGFTDGKFDNKKPDSSIIDKMKFPCEGVDYAGYYICREKTDEYHQYKTQFLYLRKGECIIGVSYDGPVDLRDKVNLFVNRIKNVSN